jgi:integrase
MAGTLRGDLADYLATRRSLGFSLDRTERLAGQFCDWLAARGQSGFTAADALEWATEPAGASRTWHAARLSAVRPFARYLLALGREAAMPPPRALGPTSRRAQPYIYSDAEARALASAAGELFRAPLKAATMTTLIGLLHATGMRIGEAIGLDESDFDRRTGTISITGAKGGKHRSNPLRADVAAAVAAYADRTDRNAGLGARRPRPMLASLAGTRLLYANVQHSFSKMRDRAGLKPRGAARPRLHDFRHTFATRSLEDAYRDGRDPDRAVGEIATWLGHAGTESEYWYLTATPELLAQVADRLEAHSGRQPATTGRGTQR